jgi:peptide/nickel transport system permease protein
MKWFLTRRVLWTVFAAWLFLSATFFAIALTPDPNKNMLRFGVMFSGGSEAEQESAVEQYEEMRGFDDGLLKRYADWMVGYATLDWGYSFVYEQPVIQVLKDRLPVTMAYLIPAILIASLLSIVTGILGAITQGSIPDRLANSVSYLGIGLPAFFTATLLQRWFEVPRVNPALGYLDPQNMIALAFPAFVLGVNLYAVQAWAIRAEAIEIVPAEFVKTLRANGAGTLRTGRHVLRNAISPVFALLVSELLVVLFVGVYVVELVFGIPGAAEASFRAFQDRDIGLVIATIVLPVVVALLANLVLDVISAYIDPRVSQN